MSSTRWAQGGVAAVIDDQDSIESHVDDTLIAGLDCVIEMSWSMWFPALEEQSIGSLNKVLSTKSDESFHLTREGGHLLQDFTHRRRDRLGYLRCA